MALQARRRTRRPRHGESAPRELPGCPNRQGARTPATKGAFSGRPAVGRVGGRCANGGASPNKAALRSMASALRKRPWAAASSTNSSQLVEGIAQLSGEYGRFHEGLAQYASGLSALAEKLRPTRIRRKPARKRHGPAGRRRAGELSSGMNQLNASTIRCWQNHGSGGSPT